MHPSYLPTIFPSCGGRSNGVSAQSKLDRYNRAQRRASASMATASMATAGVETAGIATSEASGVDELSDTPAPEAQSQRFASVMTQTDDAAQGGTCTLSCQ
ncbi:uncharacterized protein LOC125758081 [Rhipicephalus sanguineus]|uniref:uncharacterized protein LOC125758081 n=1 Tax=Rhipicephalus sanguineus TaxID=34632 RepID=UPI0020C1F8CD|nr:uncharacterized protein LOC125758081 [Rhipicephalus sanguineus]